MAEDYDHRTAVTRLEVEKSDRRLLEETIDHWRRGCQIAADLAWDSCDNKRGIQSLAYDDIRERTDLGSQHAILATHQAAEAISTCLEQREKGANPSKPRFTSPTVRYDSRTMTLFDDHSVSLTTIESRVRCSLALPDDPNGYQFTYLDSESWELTESTLTVRDGDFFLHLGFRRPSANGEVRNADAERGVHPVPRRVGGRVRGQVPRGQLISPPRRFREFRTATGSCGRPESRTRRPPSSR